MKFYIKYPGESLEHCIATHNGYPAGRNVETAIMWADMYHEDALACGETPHSSYQIVDEVGNVHHESGPLPIKRTTTGMSQYERLRLIFGGNW